MEDRAVVWQNFANKNSYLTKGVYCANHVTFSIGTVNKNILIKGQRILINIGIGPFARDGVFNEKLVVTIKLNLKNIKLDEKVFLRYKYLSKFNIFTILAVFYKKI